MDMAALGLKSNSNEILKKAASRGFIYKKEVAEMLEAGPEDNDSLKKTSGALNVFFEAMGIIVLSDPAYATHIADVFEEADAEEDSGEEIGDPEKQKSYLEKYLENVHDEVVPEGDLLGRWLHEIGQRRLLKKNEEETLSWLVQSQGDVDAREQFILHNLRLPVAIARRYRGRGLDYMDLIQEGNAGIMTAVDMFDYKKGCRFSTYATWWVRQSICRALFDYKDTIRIPVHMQELMSKVFKTSAVLMRESGREPTAEEITERISKNYEIKADLPSVKNALRYLRMTTVNLEDLARPYDDDGHDEIMDTIPDQTNFKPEEMLQAKEELVEVCGRIKKVLDAVSAIHGERNLQMFKMRYGLDDNSFEIKTLEVCGQAFGVTRERVRQVVEHTWPKLNSLGVAGDDITMLTELRRVRALENIVDIAVKI